MQTAARALLGVGREVHLGVAALMGSCLRTGCCIPHSHLTPAWLLLLQDCCCAALRTGSGRPQASGSCCCLGYCRTSAYRCAAAGVLGTSVGRVMVPKTR